MIQLCLVFAYYDYIDAKLLPDNSCYNRAHLHKIGDSNYCRVYYSCYYNLMQYNLCNVFEHFDPNKKECVPAEDFQCQNSERMPTITYSPPTTTDAPQPEIDWVTPTNNGSSTCYREHGVTVKEPTNCRSYSVCWHGVSHTGECPQGYSYNEDSEICDIANNCRCEEDTMCPPTGVHSFRKLGSCTEYNFCFAGVHSVRRCLAGLQFDRAQNKCGLASQAGCFECPVQDDKNKIVTFNGNKCDE